MDTHDIREDLKLEGTGVQKYFKELGCTVDVLNDTERGKLKITKAEATSHRRARLKLPLVFPKMKVQKTGKRKR